MSERKIINENDRPEFLGQIMDVFEDFLEAKGFICLIPGKRNAATTM